MSQHDMNLANATRSSLRADLNLALVALVDNNSGATEPATMFAYMLWADTTSGHLKQRNAANTAWIVKAKLSSDMIAAHQNQEFTNFTTGGSATAFTLTPVPALAANAAGVRFRVTFNAAAGATPTLAVSGLAAAYLKYQDSTGAKQAITSAQVPSGWKSDVEYDGTDWVVLDIPLAMFSTGDAKLTFKTAADPGWIMANDGTIGNAASGGTTRANADTVALYTLLWTNISNTWCAVSTGRGASAAADYAANKTLAIPKMLGRALAEAGAGSGLTSRALGEYLGEENHVLTTAELAAHSHQEVLATSGSGNGPASSAQGVGTVSATLSTQPAGGGSAHNTMQPTAFLNTMIKL
jgi:hypothetical protein